MIPAAFDYEVAESPEHAVELLGSREDAKLLAGGHSLIPLLKLRFARPSLLVDIGRIDRLSYVRDVGEWLAIGALTRHKAVRDDPLVQEHCPIVSHTAGLIGDPQVRHRGTIGGSLAHCDPASDLPAVILALGSELVITGRDGERTVPASEFFHGVFDSAVGPQELLTEIRVPKVGNWTGWSYLKYTRRAQDWATVGVAALVRRDNGSVDEARIALTNMGATPVRAAAVEQALVAGEANPAAYMADGTDPPTDTSASAEFRSHLARVIGGRAIEEAMAR
ncbi:MAG: aerobic carbon-monoxide dehydrogenase medium subunit [Gaiellaceae bacterium]|jgi:carbon-monoxide dehydrogenase medium subunit|nr:aerobic carbon-monoxide dehydrogenase medium subunit [Gaiellaceae bacterium]